MLGAGVIILRAMGEPLKGLAGEGLMGILVWKLKLVSHEGQSAWSREASERREQQHRL